MPNLRSVMFNLSKVVRAALLVLHDLELALQRRIKMVLDVIISPAGKKLSDF